MDIKEKIDNPLVSKMQSAPRFEIIGGKSLKGELTPQGAKNEALQILCAVLCTPERVIINNIPDIRDVNKLIDLLQEIGVKVEQLGKGSYSFQADDIDMDFMETERFAKLASALRGSIMIVGPLLARFGKAAIPKPGGDKIGRRRLDTHFTGFQSLGATFNYDAGRSFYTVESEKLKGCYMLLNEASVTGTANIVMAAVLAEGTTTIYNAACEPYLQQLCNMLVRMGAKITGIGSNLLSIQGVEKLSGTSHTMLPDMIEVGSFIGLAAMTQSEILIKNAGIQHLGIIPSVFQSLGIKMEFRGDDIFIPAQDAYEIDTFIDGSILTISDAIWPGFTPDLLSVVLVTATQAKGTILIHQKMFESRLFFVDKLIDMGAQIILCDPHRATVIGLNRSHALRGISMTSPDIRAGVALLIAALSAKGKSVIHNIEQIDRGYERIDERLVSLGAQIERMS
ncbi:MAG TPA: UDP-N-acetylglucosamine 1-carboxyvinyltransferase [Bacteroidia bacterium]|nr:UDP-N-acetylglucosamine 1-carboxyvinyltransferase [Bacteroidia bacterium]HNT79793.1 UDP-N-acetylglucosamine 1-carboxyvinyltransferase [Bacteroidia bacterium]